MTQGHEPPDPAHQPEGQQPPPPQQPPYPEQSYGQQQPYGQQPYGHQQYGAPGVPYGANPAAPYGVHPVSGIPYSDKSKLVAGLLQILLPFGIGRFYIGDTRIGVLQLVVTVLTCGIGGLWSFIDGIIMLATDSVDPQGRPLRG